MWLDFTLLLSVPRNIDPTSIQHLMNKLKVPQMDGAPKHCHAQLIAILYAILTVT